MSTFRPPVGLILFASCMALLCAQSIWTLHTQRLSVPKTNEMVINGAWMRDLEERLESTLYGRERWISPWGALRFSLFKAGSKGVVVGHNNWLFTGEEFNVPSDAEAQLASHFAAMETVRDWLHAHGVDLHIVLLPAKARVADDKVITPAPPARAALHDKIVSYLETHRFWVSDMLSDFAARYTESDATFVPRDTHWTPLTAEFTANKIASDIYNQCNTTRLLTRSYETREGAAQFYEGDLVEFVGAGVWRSFSGPPDDTIIPLETVSTEHQPLGLFDDIPIGVALVGTSYSADPTWNFTGSLKTALQTEVVNWAEDGSGPFAPMAAFLARTDLRTSPIRLVIWEMPERYFMTENAPQDKLFADFVEPIGTRTKRFLCSRSTR